MDTATQIALNTHYSERTWEQEKLAGWEQQRRESRITATVEAALDALMPTITGDEIAYSAGEFRQSDWDMLALAVRDSDECQIGRIFLAAIRDERTRRAWDHFSRGGHMEDVWQ